MMSERAGWVLAAGLGLAAFWLVLDPTILDPRNIAWLGRGDPASHYLGWHYFRDSPWTLPPGANPGFGLELGSSIFYSDSIPLLALALKVIDPLLPEPFQYFGLWILVCFLLQAVLAYKLFGAFSIGAGAQLAGSALFLFAPIFLIRMHDHYALAAQWIILAALTLYIVPERLAVRRWVALLLVASLVHAYLLFMAAAIYAADLLKRTLSHELSWPTGQLWLATGAAISFGGLWAAGFFLIGSGFGEPGFGFYKMHLLAPIDPSGWSHVLPDIPERGGDHAGFSFYGLGLLILLILAAGSLARGCRHIVRDRRWLPLLAALAVLTLLALSNNLSIAKMSARVPLPDVVQGVADLFRVSGRMSWPVFYAVALAAVVLTSRAYGARLGPVVLGAAVLVQVADTHAGWRTLAGLYAPTGSTWETPLRSPFWAAAARRYERVRSLPVRRIAETWRDVAYLAVRNGRPTDTAYLARLDTDSFASAKAAALTAVGEGRFDDGALYLLDDATARSVLPRVGPDDLFVRVDGVVAFARNGRDLAERFPDARPVDPSTLFVSVRAGRAFGFAPGEDGLQLLGHGWYKPSRFGLRSDNAISRLHFRLDDPPGRYRLRLQLSGVALDEGATVPVDVSLDERMIGTVDLGAAADWTSPAIRLETVDGAGRVHTLSLVSSTADGSTPPFAAAGPFVGLNAFEIVPAEPAP